MKDKKIINALGIVLIVFFISLTVLVSVDISNRVKESRYIGKSDNFRNTISVSGEGEVFVKPDTASLSLPVLSEGKEPQEAMRINNERSDRVIDFLKDNGIEDKDIRTVSFNIIPRYEYERLITFPDYGNRALVGYEATHSLEVKVREISNLGSILEGAVNSGANQVYGIQFIVDNEKS